MGVFTDGGTRHTLLDRTVSLSASSVLCYQAANYTVALVTLGFLEVIIYRAVQSSLPFPVLKSRGKEEGRGQHPPGVGGKRSEHRGMRASWDHCMALAKFPGPGRDGA